jgi:hypothetical protein
MLNFCFHKNLILALDIADMTHHICYDLQLIFGNIQSQLRIFLLLPTDLIPKQVACIFALANCDSYNLTWPT